MPRRDWRPAGIRAVLAGQVPTFTLEYACQADTGLRWFSMLAVPLQHGWSGALVTHTDITARRAAEADLRIAAIAFESSDGMMVTDVQGRILQVNQAFTTITGYSRDDAIGQRPNMLSSGRHGPDFYRAMWDTIKTAGHWEGEIWNRRKNGEIYPERLSIAAVKAPDGATSHYVAARPPAPDACHQRRRQPP